jgi:hypothetical protein
MKAFTWLAVPSLLWCAYTHSASALTVDNSSYVGLESTFPGSSVDFTLFGNPTTYPTVNTNGGGPGTQPTNLTDFSVAGADTKMYQGNGNFANVIAPDGSTAYTGIFFNDSGNTPDLATVTLGNTSFDYGNFNLYVMFGNSDGVQDATLSLTIGATTYSADVTDRGSAKGASNVQVEEFNIKGLAANDTFTVGATSTGGADSIGGLSFESVPEPSTYAMMLGGLSMLGLFVRRRLTA